MIDNDTIGKLRNIYESIEMSDIYDMINISKRAITPVEAEALVNDHFDSVFCPKIVKTYIARCDNMIFIRSPEVTFYIYYQTATNVNMTKLLLSLKQAIVSMRFFNVNKPLNIHIVLSPYKRYMPAQNKEHVCACNINGGFTYPSGNSIYVVREEEYTKVMIHEILHHCRDIHNNGFFDRQLNLLKKSFNIAQQTVLVPNEAVVEAWATIVNCAYLSFEYNQSFEKLIKMETEFGLHQSHKILKKQGNKPWFETTNAFCYVIFKTILLKNLSKLTGYSYPYDPEYITQFLIQHKNSVKKKIKNSDFFDKMKSKKSLRMTFFAD